MGSGHRQLGHQKMIEIRKRQPAFHPAAEFEILDADRRVFAMARRGGGQRIYALANLASEAVDVASLGADIPAEMTDLISGDRFKTDPFRLAPRRFAWLTD